MSLFERAKREGRLGFFSIWAPDSGSDPVAIAADKSRRPRAICNVLDGRSASYNGSETRSRRAYNAPAAND